MLIITVIKVELPLMNIEDTLTIITCLDYLYLLTIFSDLNFIKPVLNGAIGTL